MNKKQLFEELRAYLSDKSGEPIEYVGSTTRLYNDLCFDSLDNIEIVMELEGKFEISITPEEEDALFMEYKRVTVQDLVDFIAKKLELTA